METESEVVDTFDDSDIDQMIEIYLDDSLKAINQNIKGNDTCSKYPIEDLTPLLLKRTYDAQKILKKTQDKLNRLTAALVVLTFVLAFLTLLLYIKS